MGWDSGLSTDERDLLVELLERERGELHPEIRRTRTGEFREGLRQRLRLVEGLLERLPPSTGRTSETAIGRG
jgi:hypothetical protein